MVLYLRNVPSSYPSLPGCLGGEYQRKLYRDLMNNYNRLERPVQNDSAPIVVELGLTLLQIIDVVSVYTRVRVQDVMGILWNVKCTSPFCIIYNVHVFSV